MSLGRAKSRGAAGVGVGKERNGGRRGEKYGEKIENCFSGD